MAPQKVLCSCSACKRHTTTVNNTEVQGRWVSRRTRTKHQDIDAARETSSSSSEGEQIEEPLEPVVLDSAAITAPIVAMCALFVGTLNLRFRLGRNSTNLMLQCLQILVNGVIEIVLTALRMTGEGLNVRTPKVNLPKDVRSIYGLLDVEPTLERTICCPKCFKLFNTNNPAEIPLTCNYRKSPRARICGEMLWKTRNTRRGTKQVPKSLYFTQDFGSWLQSFLQRQDIEEALTKTHQNTRNTPPDIMKDLHDSPAWIAAKQYHASPYNLLFAFYIDWFNPFTNKIAGKVVSCGVLVLYCLNLPPHLRYLAENIFIVGLIPLPHQPDGYTSSHILAPLVRTLQQYCQHPVAVPTFSQPGGMLITIYILVLIADLQAIRKIGGFLSPSLARFFCSFCLCTQDEKDGLDLIWQLRDNATVRQQALVWKDTVTLKAKGILEGQNGVRWTPLHDLHYWDAVNHLVLGFMHNWLEGICSEHLRTYLGVGRDVKLQKKLDASEHEERIDETFTDSDSAESAGDLDDLLRDMANDSDSSAGGLEGRSTPTPMDTYVTEEDSSDDDDDDLDYQPVPDTAHKFDSFGIGLIRSCIEEITMPTHITRPPTNLGQASHGKLKADELLILFSAILPVVLPEVWHTTNSNDPNFANALLTNFNYLVEATTIVISFAVSNADADRFGVAFRNYRRSAQTLFPGFASKPNHHMAMHNPMLLKLWGPLPALSEFFGERINGMLQKVPTSRRKADIPLTMLRQMCRSSRLSAKIKKIGSENSTIVGCFANYLNKDNNSTILSYAPIALTTAEFQAIRARSKPLNHGQYDAFHQFIIRHTNQQWHSYRILPYPSHIQILPNLVLKIPDYTINKKTFSTKLAHLGNSTILYENGKTGTIKEIWQVILLNCLHTFFLVERHQLLSQLEEQMAPFRNFPSLNVKIVTAAPSEVFDMITPQVIATHLTTWRRPKGTFGIDKEMLVLCWGLQRGQS